MPNVMEAPNFLRWVAECWNRLFIIDGVISMPIAIAGYFMIPDTPEITRARYFTPDVSFADCRQLCLAHEFQDIALAQRRMELEGRGNRAPYTRLKLKKIFTSWHVYVLALLYVLFNNGNQSAAPVFAQFLKDSKDPKYSVAQINVYPTATYGVQIFTALAFAWSSDSFLKGNRLPPIIFAGVGDDMKSSYKHELNGNLDCEHNLLFVIGSLEYRRRMALGLLHPRGYRIRNIWNHHGLGT